jgi:hypothetical protein
MSSVQVTAEQRLGARAAAMKEAGQARLRSPFLPLLLMGLALLAWMVFQTVALLQERVGLDRTLAAQQPQVTQSTQLRTALSDLASDTQKLADAGDPNAQLIVNQLRQHGITIHPDAVPAGSN